MIRLCIARSLYWKHTEKANEEEEDEKKSVQYDFDNECCVQ